MEANTLRIGNYVYDDFKEIHKVEFISSDEYKNWIKEPQIILSKINGLKGFYQSDEVFPIPLSEDILMKLGFEINDDEHWNLKGNVPWTYKEATYGENPITKDYLIVLKNTGQGWFYKNGYFKIDFVHQLQNLKFALCGEELTIKE